MADWLLAVDPGGEHVGTAVYRPNPDGSWSCVSVREFQPLPFEDWLTEQLYIGRVRHLVVERFALYPEMAPLLAGSEMETSQLIGVIKYIHRASANRREPLDPCTIEFQPASIKTATRSVLKKRGIASVATRLGIPGDHVRDAELHGAYALMKTRGLAVVAADEVFETAPLSPVW